MLLQQIESSSGPLATTLRIVNELIERNPVLAYVAIGHLLLSVTLGFLWIMDDSVYLLGINRWIKPLKFTLSVVFYLGTMAWIWPDLYKQSRYSDLMAYALAFTMILEIVLITMQSARGVRSHFNNASAFDSIVYSLMAIGAFGNATLMTIVFFNVFLGENLSSDKVFHEAILWGLGIFVLGATVGIYIAAVNMQPTVGASPGTKGLPFLNWALEAGDFRPAHFIGLHALQIIPLGLVLSRQIGLEGTITVRLLGTLILMAVSMAFFQAMAGYSITSGKVI